MNRIKPEVIDPKPVATLRNAKWFTADGNKLELICPATKPMKLTDALTTMIESLSLEEQKALSEMLQRKVLGRLSENMQKAVKKVIYNGKPL